MAKTEIAIWRARADQARRVARMLSTHDVELVEAFAHECDDNVRSLLRENARIFGDSPGGRRKLSVEAVSRQQAA
jgi:hypothetical protein